MLAMIKSLSIRNYALIQELEMSPDPKLNIITGETGAGKSIMLGAVGMLLGNRVDSKILLNENQKCFIEGLFDVSGYKLETLFEEENLDFEKECVIRREISPSGKSRAFVNDTPTTLMVLKRIGEKLLDVHSQHQSLRLGDNQYQLEVLDAFASHSALLESYKEAFSIYDSTQKKLVNLEQRASESIENADYKEFLFKELTEANLDNLDKDTLEKELEVVEHAEDIKQKLAQSIGMLEESEIAILHQLSEVKSFLQSLANFSKELNSVSERIGSANIELKDLTDELNRIQESIEYDPTRTKVIKEQLDQINRLEKKHAVRNTQELINLRDQLDRELQSTLNLDEEVMRARKDLEEAEERMQKAGKKLSESRQLSAINLADEIEKIIKKIGIENGSIELVLSPAKPNVTGLDKLQMLFSANKGIKTQEIKNVASGGEFSRLIFAIKYLIADKTALPTIIFDEIDTGVSGKVALQMIQMMKEMSKSHQVISISHLPQFAAGGDSHYYIYKDHSSERSFSKVKKLNREERIEEIAKMIGGQTPGESAIQSAKELLKIG